MITLLTGENSFEIERFLANIVESFSGVAEMIDGESLQIPQLPDILMGASLFSTERLIIIRNLGENKQVWPVFANWLNKISADIHLVIIEPKPDKRTITFKALKKSATIKEFNLWTERDTFAAEKWLIAEAEQLNLVLDKKSIQLIVRRVGLDQWQLLSALDKLTLVDEISDEVIIDLIDANPIENVFNLLNAALEGDISGLKNILRTLKQTEEAYSLLAPLSTQAFQLLATASASASASDNVSKDFGIHPYAMSKLKIVAKRIGRGGAAKIVTIFAQADDDIKKSRAEPWLLLERALIKVASI